MTYTKYSQIESIRQNVLLNVGMHSIEFYNFCSNLPKGQWQFSEPQEWPILIESCYEHLNFYSLIKSSF